MGNQRVAQGDAGSRWPGSETGPAANQVRWRCSAYIRRTIDDIVGAPSCDRGLEKYTHRLRRFTQINSVWILYFAQLTVIFFVCAILPEGDTSAYETPPDDANCIADASQMQIASDGGYLDARCPRRATAHQRLTACDIVGAAVSSSRSSSMRLLRTQGDVSANWVLVIASRGIACDASAESGQLSGLHRDDIPQNPDKTG